jgi:hypothetical protein
MFLKSQTLIILSLPPEASWYPLEFQLNPQISPMCLPFSRLTLLPYLVSNILIFLSLEPDARMNYYLGFHSKQPILN